MKVVALAGGVGGAKLADGISRLVPKVDLSVIVNTGDDFTHFGLNISPDLDTVCYNLAGFENPETGWGRASDNMETMETILHLGGPDWFSLGNLDLATHLERTRRLEDGDLLSSITADFCRVWGIKSRIIPMSDDPVPTLVKTDRGIMPFQEYYVKLGTEPSVSGFIFQDIDKAKPAPGVLSVIEDADLVVICPSNPWVSIDPILSVPGIRLAVEKKVVLAISPIIDGKAVKGPAAKMYQEMGVAPSATAVAEHYRGLLTGFIIDQRDQNLIQEIFSSYDGKLNILYSDTLMKTHLDRIRLAGEVIIFGKQLIKEA
ncbi:MAG: 2-phospho-L-lactate transferase [Anaerolineales bacterium]|nr:MAG: 2-phospho-L-lactate transferase [Anaerolineales bacterium]